MVVHGIIGLQLDSLQVVLNGLLVLFQRVVPCTDISVVARYVWVDLDRFIDKLYLFLVVAQLAQSSSFEVVKLCLISEFESLVAVLDEFVPSFHQKQRVGYDQVFLQAFIHFLSLLKYLLEFFLLLELVDPLAQLHEFRTSKWPSVVELLKLDIHINAYNFNFNSHNNMLKKIACTAVALTKRPQPFQQSIRPYGLIQRASYYSFCSQRSLTPADIPAQNLKVAEASTIVGEEQISYYKTQGGISILDKVPGVKSQTGQLYVLSFTCTKCNSQSIRSFTKHAYHNGVVIVRCSGCQNNHLVADNLGWFQDTPVNVETMYQGQIKKVHDHVAIVKFLKAAFEDEAEKKEEGTAEKKRDEPETKLD